MRVVKKPEERKAEMVAAAAKLFAPPDAQRALSEPEEQERKRKLLEHLNTAKKGL